MTMAADKKLCVLFPGIGYHCDKPLLYYSAKLARRKGYEVIPLRYSDFPEGAKGNEEKMRASADHAFRQTVEQLAGADMSRYGRILFIGKSIGTAVCLRYRAEFSVPAECILLTPLEMTFDFPSGSCTAFHGTADQWADTAAIVRLCEKHGVPLHTYKGANHSIETGDPMKDIDYLKNVTGVLDGIMQE